MKASESLALVKHLVHAFPRTKLKPETLALYSGYLQPFDFDDAKKAIHAGCMKWRFFPSVAELVEAIESVSQKYLAPELAWAEVIAAVRAGRHGEAWSSPALARAVDAIGGMSYLMSAPLVAMPGPDRARFVDAYRVALTSTVDTERVEQLEAVREPIGIVSVLAKQLTRGDDSE